MISANEVRKQFQKEIEEHKIHGRTKQDIYDIVDRDILSSAKKGRNHCCFYPYHTVYDCWVDEMMTHYKRLGYTFKPTGCVGGVPQDTIEICW